MGAFDDIDFDKVVQERQKKVLSDQNVAARQETEWGNFINHIVPSIINDFIGKAEEAHSKRIISCYRILRHARTKGFLGITRTRRKAVKCWAAEAVGMGGNDTVGPDHYEIKYFIDEDGNLLSYTGEVQSIAYYFRGWRKDFHKNQSIVSLFKKKLHEALLGKCEGLVVYGGPSTSLIGGKNTSAVLDRT